jgi:regulator of protease activity HflC (stomatin/prohibitin superfamily)
MTVILTGILILIIGFFIAKVEPLTRKYTTLIKTVGAIVLFTGLALKCVVQIEPGQVGVQKLFGKVNNNILESGLNLINPLVKVVMFDVRTENYTGGDC